LGQTTEGDDGGGVKQIFNYQLVAKLSLLSLLKSTLFMFSNYLKIALRNLLKHRTFSILNIGGLGIGMAVCMLILMYVSHEMSFDRFHAKGDRVFSALMKLKMGEQDIQMNSFAPEFAAKVKEANPEIMESMRFVVSPQVSPTVKSEEGRQFIENKVCFADPSIFRVLTFNFLKGNPQTALDMVEGVVISDAMAKKYFGEQDPIGKSLIYNKKDQLQVTGVFEKMPLNSTLQFDFIGTASMYENITKRENPKNARLMYQTWFLLDNPAATTKIEQVIPSTMPKSNSPIMSSATFVLSPLQEMHLGNNWGDFSNSKYISVFLIIAGLVLFLALFNYMNLTTALAGVRAREVGVRKVLGANRAALSRQFYSESVLVSAMGFGLGLCLFALIRPAFSKMLGLEIDDRFLYSSLFTSVLGGLFLLSALVAGSYPALLLSRFSPMQILKGNTSTGNAGSGVRKTLIVFQFVVSVALIVFSIGIREQLSFMRNKDIGLNREQVMVLPLTKIVGTHFPAFKQEIRDITGVQNVATASTGLFQGGWNMYFIKSPATQEDVTINAMTVDEHFFETLEIDWITPPVNGNTKDLAAKSQIVINETGIDKFKIGKDPIGQRLELMDKTSEIAGVVKDFNFASLANKVEGMLFEIVPEKEPIFGAGHLYIRLATNTDYKEKVATIGAIFKKYDADAPFDYYFLDEAFNKQYSAEQRMGYLFSGFTGVALLLACFGLLGLVMFSAEQRNKEIGVRKVLGASVLSVVGLLSKDFLKLVLIALVIATPLAYWAMDKWLTDFAYRIDIQWWMFAVGSLSAVLIALFTVSFQSVKAALVNPVKSLRSE
jgi:putative ABC transport system permease protein